MNSMFLKKDPQENSMKNSPGTRRVVPKSNSAGEAFRSFLKQERSLKRIEEKDSIQSSDL